MQNTETLLHVIRERGRRGLPLARVYRMLFNPELYLLAYGRLSRNAGAMTQGTTEETVDAMSMAKIEKLIARLREERYRWTPVRRVEIPKRDGGTRPLGIPTWSDKLLQEVMRLILDAYYEPQFSEHSHGFRPKRGCHTALLDVTRHGKGTKWFVEGDIKGCFDNIDHTILLSILRERIYDNRFLRLVENLLRAGYCEYWHYHPSFSGTPQGGVISPILSNIYLDRLDRYVEQSLLPVYNRGKQRKRNPAWNQATCRVYKNRLRGRYEDVRRWDKARRQIPSCDPTDPDFRRLHFVRYADDFLLCFTGPKHEAEEIKTQLKTFLHESLRLELSEEKTLITHAATESARFLGYDIHSQHCDSWRDSNSVRSVNGVLALRVPRKVVSNACQRYVRRREALPPRRTRGRDGLRHRPAVSMALLRTEELLPVGPEYRRLGEAAVGHGVIASANAGQQAQGQCREALAQAQEHGADRRWPATMYHRQPRLLRQKATGSQIRRAAIETTAHGHPQRSSSHPSSTTHGTGQTIPCGYLRSLQRGGAS